MAVVMANKPPSPPPSFTRLENTNLEMEQLILSETEMETSHLDLIASTRLTDERKRRRRRRNKQTNKQRNKADNVVCAPKVLSLSSTTAKIHLSEHCTLY